MSTNTRRRQTGTSDFSVTSASSDSRSQSRQVLVGLRDLNAQPTPRSEAPNIGDDLTSIMAGGCCHFCGISTRRKVLVSHRNDRLTPFAHQLFDERVQSGQPVAHIT
ncbi:MAG: hypothetical protein ACJA14_001925 [Ilumatobacter sp.]|jgi:hypothetical protein